MKIKINKGFTLLEVLIALSISIFIIYGMTQIYSNTVKFIDNSRERIGLNKKAILLFNQLENDISTAFVAQFNKEESKKDQDKVPKGLKQKKQVDNKYFLAEIYDDEVKKIDTKKYYLFKNINFISTNPLVVHGQNIPRLVRIKYVLEKDKEKSKEKDCYNLYRYQTYDIKNFNFKEAEDNKLREKQYLIQKYLVADNIKNFFVEYITQKPVEEDKVKKNEEEKEIRSFVWNAEFIKKNLTPKKKLEQQKNNKKEADEKKNEQQEVKYVVPRYAEIRITFWNYDLSREHDFYTLVPIWSYPTKEIK